MAYLIYRLLGVVALWTSYIHCQLTLYQASNDVFGLASATLQEVGIADGATTYIHVVSLAPDSIILETMVVSASGFSEDTDNTLLGLAIAGGCQFVAATSVSCEIDSPFSSDIAVGTPLAFEVSVETMLVTSQRASSSLASQTTGTPPFLDATSSVLTSSIITSTPMPSSSIDLPSAPGTPTPSIIVSTGSSDALTKTALSAAVIGGVLGGIIFLFLIFFIYWFVRRRRAKQLAYLKATRAIVYSESFGASNYNTNAAAAPRQDTKQVINEGYSDSKEVAALRKQIAEMLGGSSHRGKR